MRLLRTIGGIDFTGQERAALNKLTMPLPRTTEYVQACLTRLDDLGSYRYKLVGWRVVPFASGTVDVRSRARRRARDARRSASRWGRRRAPVRGRARLRADRGHTQLDGRGFLLGAGARTETVEAFFKQGADDRHDDDQGYGRAAGATRRWSPATPRPSASKPARSADPQVPLENNGLASGPIASKSWSRILQSAAARAAASILTIWNGGRPVGWRGRHAPAAFVEGEI